MATSKVSVTEGSGKNLATNSFVEDAVTKEAQRVVLNDSTGSEITANIGALTETAPANDAASSGLNGRLQRIAQRITSLIALLPTALGTNSGLKVDSVLPKDDPANFVSGAITTAMTGTTSTSLLAAPGVSLRNYITTIIVSNAHGTVGTDVIIQDGSGGTILMTIPAAAVYGGAVITLPTPLKQPTTNTAIFCANVTTGASTKVSAVGYKGA